MCDRIYRIERILKQAGGGVVLGYCFMGEEGRERGEEALFFFFNLVKRKINKKNMKNARGVECGLRFHRECRCFWPAPGVFVGCHVVLCVGERGSKGEGWCSKGFFNAKVNEKEWRVFWFLKGCCVVVIKAGVVFVVLCFFLRAASERARARGRTGAGKQYCARGNEFWGAEEKAFALFSFLPSFSFSVAFL